MSPRFVYYRMHCPQHAQRVLWASHSAQQNLQDRNLTLGGQPRIARMEVVENSVSGVIGGIPGSDFGDIAALILPFYLHMQAYRTI